MRKLVRKAAHHVVTLLVNPAAHDDVVPNRISDQPWFLRGERTCAAHLAGPAREKHIPEDS